MDTTNSGNVLKNIVMENITPILIYFVIFIGILIIVILGVFFKKEFPIASTLKNLFTLNENEKVETSITLIIFTILLVIGCIGYLLLPENNNFKILFQQIGNVSAVIIFTIFFILFFKFVPNDIMDKYSFIIVPCMLALTAYIFYLGMNTNYMLNFNVNYERIKYAILMFCFITVLITYYSINPGGYASALSGYSLLLTILLCVFAFLYLITLFTLPTPEGKSNANFLNNFSKFSIFGSLGFLGFLALATIILSSYKDGLKDSSPGPVIILVLTLIISIIWSIALITNTFKTTDNVVDMKNMDIRKNSLLTIFGLVISGLLVGWLVYNINSFMGSESTFSFIMNLLLVLSMMVLIYKSLNVSTPETMYKKQNTFFNLLTSIIFYIPCLFYSKITFITGILSQIFGEASTKTTADKNGMIFLGGVILLYLVYFIVPMLTTMFLKQGGKQLVNKPVATDVRYALGTYEDLNGSGHYDYQFGLSCWVFVDSMAPNTNISYTKYTSLLNFANKPNILYNPSKRMLLITCQIKDLKRKTRNKLIDFDNDGNLIIYKNNNFLLQKWNNIIINYNGGVLDIFLNGELVKSVAGVVPYYTLDSLTIGEDNGLKGGICNVVYFNRPLTATNIYYMYQSMKNQTPPVISDSPITIIKKEAEYAKNN